jgi:hypothetical protein
MDWGTLEDSQFYELWSESNQAYYGYAPGSSGGVLLGMEFVPTSENCSGKVTRISYRIARSSTLGVDGKLFLMLFKEDEDNTYIGTSLNYYSINELSTDWQWLDWEFDIELTLDEPYLVFLAVQNEGQDMNSVTNVAVLGSSVDLTNLDRYTFSCHAQTRGPNSSLPGLYLTLKYGSDVVASETAWSSVNLTYDNDQIFASFYKPDASLTFDKLCLTANRDTEVYSGQLQGVVVDKMGMIIASSTNVISVTELAYGPDWSDIEFIFDPPVVLPPDTWQRLGVKVINVNRAPYNYVRLRTNYEPYTKSCNVHNFSPGIVYATYGEKELFYRAYHTPNWGLIGLSQNFTPDKTGFLKSVKVYLTKYGQPSDGVRCKIEDASGEVMAISTLVNFAEGEVTFPFNLPVGQGETYKIVVYRASERGSRAHYWLADWSPVPATSGAFGSLYALFAGGDTSLLEGTLRTEVVVDQVYLEGIDITDYASRITIDVGRGSFGQSKKGVADILIRDPDGAFSLTNGDSPLYGLFDLRSKIKISLLTDDLIKIPLFTGYVTSFKPRFTRGIPAKNIYLEDAFFDLEATSITLSAEAGKTASQIVEQVLLAAGWHLGLYEIESATDEPALGAASWEDESALAILNQLVESGFHAHYITADGKYKFVLNKTVNLPTLAPLTLNLDESLDGQAEITYTLKELVNRVVVWYSDENYVEVNDTTSQGKYGVFSLEIDNPLVATASYANELAEYVLSLYKSPVAQVKYRTADARLISQLSLGQTVIIKSDKLRLNAQAAIANITYNIEGPLVEAEVSFTPYGDIVDLSDYFDYEPQTGKEWLTADDSWQAVSQTFVVKREGTPVRSALLEVNLLAKNSLKGTEFVKADIFEVDENSLPTGDSLGSSTELTVSSAPDGRNLKFTFPSESRPVLEAGSRYAVTFPTPLTPDVEQPVPYWTNGKGSAGLPRAFSELFTPQVTAVYVRFTAASSKLVKVFLPAIVFWNLTSQLTCKIYTVDESGQPGTLVGNLNSVQWSGTGTFPIFSTPSPITLTSGSDYFAQVSIPMLYDKADVSNLQTTSYNLQSLHYGLKGIGFRLLLTSSSYLPVTIRQKVYPAGFFNASTELESIRFFSNSSSAFPSGTVCKIYLDDEGQPGTLLGTANLTYSGFVLGAYCYTASFSPTISITTTQPYWVVIYSANGFGTESSFLGPQAGTGDSWGVFTATDSWLAKSGVLGFRNQIGLAYSYIGVTVCPYDPIAPANTLRLKGSSVEETGYHLPLQAFYSEEPLINTWSIWGGATLGDEVAGYLTDSGWTALSGKSFWLKVLAKEVEET